MLKTSQENAKWGQYYLLIWPYEYDVDVCHRLGGWARTGVTRFTSEGP